MSETHKERSESDKGRVRFPSGLQENGCDIYLSDCLGVLERLKEFSVDMVFADPPYLLSNGGLTCASGRAKCVDKGAWDKSKGVAEDCEFHRSWIAACRRVLKPGGTLWVSGTYHSIYACGYALSVLGFRVLNEICWFKPNASPNLACRCFTASHETLIWARKSPVARHTFNYATMKRWDSPQDPIKKPDRQTRSVWAISATPIRSVINNAA